MTCTCQTDDDSGPPCAVGSQWLGKKGQQGEEGEDEHGEHTSVVGIHTLLFYKELGQVTTIDRQHGNDGIEGEDERNSLCRARLVTILVGEIGGSPEQIEPPNTIGEELTSDKRPGLTIAEALEERNLLGRLLRYINLSLGCHIIILMDVVELSHVDM